MNLVAGCLWDNPASAAAGAMQKGSCLRSPAVMMRPAPRRAAGVYRGRRRRGPALGLPQKQRE